MNYTGTDYVGEHSLKYHRFILAGNAIHAIKQIREDDARNAIPF